MSDGDQDFGFAAVLAWLWEWGGPLIAAGFVVAVIFAARTVHG